MRNRTGSASNIEWCNGHLEWMANTKRRSPKTVYSYRQTYMSLLEAVHTPFSKVTADELREWLFRPRRNGDPAPATLKRELAAVRAMFKWAAARDMLSGADPTLLLLEELPKVDNEQPKPVALKDWRSVWFSDLTDDERVALGLGCFVGLRRMEICGLSPEQVRFGPAALAGVKRKGGKRMLFHIESPVVLYEQRLAEWVGDAEELWWKPLRRLSEARRGSVALMPWCDEKVLRFETRTLHRLPSGVVNPDLMNKRMNKMFDRLGLEPLLFHPHQLRHAFGTNLVSVGVPIEVVSQLMGHSSLDITRRYVELGSDPLAKLVDGLKMVSRH